MPAKTEKQRKFMGAELGRKRAGKKTGMSEKKLEEMASKKKSKKSQIESRWTRMTPRSGDLGYAN